MSEVKNVVVIDYGIGNMLSVQRALEHCGAEVLATSDPDKILNSSHLVLPGVGAFGDAMQSLLSLGLVEIIKEAAAANIPLLGICLGMQLLFEESEEFGLNLGLGLIPGRILPIPVRSISGEALKVPHMGWSSLYPSGDTNEWKKTILRNNSPNDAVYFVHSFSALPADPAHRIADCFYGGNSIAAVVGRNSVVGCQFHPEKSGEVGLTILKQFIGQ